MNCINYPIKRIQAAPKARGLTRQKSVDAAKRRIKDDAMYLITRHGGLFRPKAQGYTMEIADAAVYPGSEAKQYLDVEGLALIPLVSVRLRIVEEIKRLEQQISGLQEKLAIGRVE